MNTNENARASWTKIGKGFLTLALAGLSFLTSEAHATAAFSRQTGESCATCHMQAYGPWLTEYGTKFKLDGYVAGDAAKIPTLLNNFSAEIVASVSNVASAVPQGSLYGNNKYQSNAQTNVVNDWDAIFFTGRVLPKVGAYLQMQITPQTGRQIFLSMADIRFADHFNFEGHSIQYGVTANNAPTMSDTWMTSFAWMYPYTNPVGSGVSPAPNAQPWLASLMGSATSAGMTAYTKIDNHWYFEAGGYTNQSIAMGQGLGIANNLGSNDAIVGGAGYWRVYWDDFFGPHHLMIGSYGLAGNTAPNCGASGACAGQNYSTALTGTNSIQEINLDTNYSYMMDDKNMFMFMWRYTHDSIKNSAWLQTQCNNGICPNASNGLNNNMVMGMWTYDKTYNLSFAWNHQWGTSDRVMYGNLDDSGLPNPVTGSANGSPNLNSFLVEVDYIPFGKGRFLSDPYFNMRLSLQYWAYTQFNGATTNYDGNGRSAGQNNTTYFVTNINF